MKTMTRILVAGLAILAAVPAVLAGGPLYVYDPAARTPGAWPAGATPVYLDLGSFGILSNEEADAMMAFSVAQWNDVPTSSFQGVIAGDFASIGLPDIDASNVLDVLGTYNGGGIHVIYDADGSIHDLIFGNPYILGFTLLEWVDEDSPALVEATMILNGSRVPDWLPPAEAAAKFAGIATHEFGHAINLAHSQTNGQLILWYDVSAGPNGCGTPYAGWPEPSQVETMYPYTDLFSTAEAAATVDHLDDRATASDLYPAAGWPAAYPSIEGTVYLPGVSRWSHEERRHGPRREPYTGVNVIARNLANPFGDAISALSGNASQGEAGPDGAYEFHGLTPGASYVVYVDGILAGAFSTPIRTVLPGPEEFYNGHLESGDGLKDDRCAWSSVPAVAGCTRDVNITFNKVQGAPEFIPVELPMSSLFDLTRDGGIGVGTWAGGIYRWSEEGGPEPIGGSPYSPSPGISEDGQWIVGDITDHTSYPQDVEVASVWLGGENWMPIGTVPGNTNCDSSLISAWDAANTGKLVGLSWRSCTDVTGYEWTSGGGIHELGYLGDSDFSASRADAISADGTRIVGWDRNFWGFWRGARWDNGQESLFELNTPAICGNDPTDPYAQMPAAGAAIGISGNGSYVVGEGYPIEREIDMGDGTFYRYCDDSAWRWSERTGVESLGDFQYEGYRTYGADVSDDGKVIVGGAHPFTPWDAPRSALWTSATGMIDFQEFLAAQGTFANDWIIVSASAVSSDGKTISGAAYTPFGIQGFVVRIPKAIVCHHTHRRRGHRSTISVSFPEGLDAHLAHGDTLGMCSSGY